MKKVAYLTLLLMLLFVGKSFAGAAIVPAFGTFSCATGGKISAGQQGSNTLNIQGEGGAVITVSKVSGRPTLIISTDGSTGSSSSTNNNSAFDITGGIMFNPVDVYLGLAPLPVSFYKGQYFWTRNNVGGSIYLIRCDADTTYTTFLLSDTQHWLNMDLGGASVQGFHLVGTGKVGPTGSLSFNNISTALRSSYNSQPEVFVLNNADKFSFWGYVSNAFQKITWTNIVNQLSAFFHGLTITFTEISGEPSSNVKLNNALNGKAPHRPATFTHLSSAATGAASGEFVVDPRKYGAATTNTAAQNDIAINNAVAAMTAGQQLIIPLGSFEINSVVFNPPDGCSLVFYGELVGAGNGVALTIGDVNTQKNKYVIRNINVRSKTLDRTIGRVGVRAVNLDYATVEFKNLYGFYENLIVEGINGIGNAYNEYHIGRNINATKLIHLKATSGGWANQNSFYNGWLDFTPELGSLQSDFAGCVGLTIDYSAANGINSNVFINTSFEGSKYAKAFDVSGTFNQFIGTRRENVGMGEFTTNSQYNVYMPVYEYANGETGDKNGPLDNGQRNKILVKDNWKITGANGEGPILTLQNKWGSSYQAMNILDANGNETTYIDGSGNAQFKSSIRLFSSAYGIYTGTGAPEGSVVASPSSLYLRRDGSVGTSIYYKSVNTDATGWIALGGAVTTALSSLSDTAISSPANANYLRYDSTSSKWKNSGLLLADFPTTGTWPTLTGALSFNLTATSTPMVWNAGTSGAYPGYMRIDNTGFSILGNRSGSSQFGESGFGGRAWLYDMTEGMVSLTNTGTDATARYRKRASGGGGTDSKGLLLNDDIPGDVYYGWDGASWVEAARIRVRSAEAWDETHRGLSYEILTRTASGSYNSRFIIDINGNIIMGAVTATSINGTSIPSSATLTTTVASGTASLGTSAIASGTCATAVSVTATGVTTSDVIDWGFGGDPTGVTGYVPSTNGMLTIITYPTANFANFKVCNNTGASVTPGAITLNFKVRR